MIGMCPACRGMLFYEPTVSVFLFVDSEEKCASMFRRYGECCGSLLFSCLGLVCGASTLTDDFLGGKRIMVLAAYFENEIGRLTSYLIQTLYNVSYFLANIKI